jgi:hypothetical protein
MSPDPIVAEIRALREAFAKQFNYDLQAICRHLREQEKRSGRRTVLLPPKRVETVDQPPPTRR